MDRIFDKVRIIPEHKPDDLSRSGTTIIGLTGGAGSGKSEVAAVFEELGLPVVYADRVGHELLEDKEVMVALRDAFQDTIFTGERVDRAKLRKRVFGDPEARYILNRIVHPRMAQRIESWCRELAGHGHRIIIIDGALLCEDGCKTDFLDGLIVVDSDQENRVERLVQKRGLTQQEAEMLVQAQADPKRKLTLADWIIENNRTLEDLRAAARALVKEIAEYAR